MWLGYDRKQFGVTGEFEIERRERPGFEYDQIDLMLSPEAWGEAYVMLSVVPGRTPLRIRRHHPNGLAPWDELLAVAGPDVPVTIRVSAKAWRFEYRLPWAAIGMATPAPGTRLSLNVDRWHFSGPAWWASWALTPPQIGGEARLGEPRRKPME